MSSEPESSSSIASFFSNISDKKEWRDMNVGIVGRLRLLRMPLTGKARL